MPNLKSLASTVAEISQTPKFGPKSCFGMLLAGLKLFRAYHCSSSTIVGLEISWDSELGGMPNMEEPHIFGQSDHWIFICCHHVFYPCSRNSVYTNLCRLMQNFAMWGLMRLG